MTAGATLWSLIDARADATPHAIVTVDESGRTMTFGELRTRAERVAAGLTGLGVVPESRVSWQLPTWIESFVLVGALARIGALQNPMLPIYRERELRFILGEVRPQLVVAPTRWRGHEHLKVATAVVDELRAATDLDCRVLACDRELPDGDPPVLPPPPADADDGPLGLLHVGDHRRPQGRPPLRHHDRRRCPRRRRRVRARRVRSVPGRLPVHAHRRCGHALHPAPERVGAIVLEQFDAQSSAPILARTTSRSPPGARRSRCCTSAYQRRHPETPAFPDLRGVMTGAAPKRLGCTTSCATRSAASVRSRVRAHRGTVPVVAT